MCRTVAYHHYCFTDFVAYSGRIPQHVRRWRELLLSAELGRFPRRSPQSWSCGQSDTLPLFRMLDNLPAYRSRSLFFDMFTGWSRCYSVQPLRHTVETEPGKSSDFAGPSADVKPNVPTTDIGSHVKLSSNDSFTAAAGSKQQHSDTATGVQQTVVDSNEVVSQVETSEKVGLMQRFRMMYKQYGVLLVSVHIATSAVWISMFYGAAVR